MLSYKIVYIDILILIGNPVCKDPEYKSFILAHLGINNTYGIFIYY